MVEHGEGQTLKARGPYAKSFAQTVKESIPKDTFLDHYLKMMSVQETPLAYDVWCGLWCLSNAATRMAVVARPRAPVRLNNYIILAAESGVTRKSTAVNTATRIVGNFISRANAAIEFLHTKTTPERLEQVLAESSAKRGHAQFAFGVSELVTALGSERYNLAMPGLLTDLYDCPTHRRTTGTIERGSSTIERVYGTFLSASTPTWLLRAINPDVIEGGFTSRCFFIVEEDRKQVVPWPTEPDQDYEALLVDRLCTVYKQMAPSNLKELEHEKRFDLHPDAKEEFVRWYESRTLSVDPFLTSFEAREDSHILKTAALLAINEDSGYVSVDNLRTAGYLVGRVKEVSGELFSYTSHSEITRIIEKVRNVILAAGATGIKHGEVVAKLGNITRAKRLGVILNVMHRTDMVKRFEYTPETGRPGTLWVATSKLKSGDFLKVMLEELQGAIMEE